MMAGGFFNEKDPRRVVASIRSLGPTNDEVKLINSSSDWLITSIAMVSAGCGTATRRTWFILKFSNSELEREYTSFTVKNTCSTTKQNVVYGTMFFLMLAAFSTVISPSSLDRDRSAFIVVCWLLCGALCALIFCVNNLILKSFPKEGYLKTRYCERIVLLHGFLMAFCLAFGHSPSAYNNSTTMSFCGKNNSNGEGCSDKISTWAAVYYLINGIWPCLFSMFYMELAVVRFVMFVPLLVVALMLHAIRSLLIHPIIPSGDDLIMAVWILVNYVMFPTFVIVLARNGELRKREEFTLNRKLRLETAKKQKASSTTAAAGAAVVFQEPTAEERHVVAKIFDAPEMSWLAPYQVWFEDMEFQTRIGHGQFGEVILATFHGARCVAKRMLRTNVDETFFRHLLNEVKVVYNLRHPNVVQFLGISWNNVANICLLFEYVPRGDLTGVLRDKQVFLSWDDPKLSMAIDVARGLAYLHAQRPAVLHRDLKPDNVLVTNTFNCKLSDFGSAKLESNVNASRVGTALYMAPEVFMGGSYTTAVDVFSFGILLWELHAHFRPFADLHVTVEALLCKTAVDRLRPPVDPTMPPELRAIMERCWSHDPGSRPKILNVAQELVDLQSALSKVHTRKRAQALARRRREDYSGSGSGWISACSSGELEEDSRRTPTAQNVSEYARIQSGVSMADVECDTVADEVSGAREKMIDEKKKKDEEKEKGRVAGGGGRTDSTTSCTVVDFNPGGMPGGGKGGGGGL